MYLYLYMISRKLLLSAEYLRLLEVSNCFNLKKYYYCINKLYLQAFLYEKCICYYP